MPRLRSVLITPTLSERHLLGKWHKGTLSTKYSRRLMLRADIIMRATRGQTNYKIAKQLGISRNTVKLWRHRFARDGMAGLQTRPIPGRPRKIAQALKALESGEPFPGLQHLPRHNETKVL